MYTDTIVELLSENFIGENTDRLIGENTDSDREGEINICISYHLILLPLKLLL